MHYLHLLYITCIFESAVISSKPNHNNQRIFNDVASLDFIDPSKHGFHIVLRQDFVSNYLQLVHQPTIFASAIAVRSADIYHAGSRMHNRSMTTHHPSQLRLSKTLYPELGNPDDDLLDGRAIKLSGLLEKTWYYVCVEFESDLKRYERITGMSCQLKRTLDKFGQNVDSTVNEIELIDTTDQSITVRLSLSIDFPMFLHVYLDPMDTVSPTPPMQTFFLRPVYGDQQYQLDATDQQSRLNVYFGPFLKPDTVYGKMCVMEEPCLETYSATGRAISAKLENCYFDELKTKSALKNQIDQKRQRDSPMAQIRSFGIGSVTISEPVIQYSMFVISMFVRVLMNRDHIW